MPVRSHRLIAAAAFAVVGAVTAAGCAGGSAEEKPTERSAAVVPIEGTDRVQVRLTEDAVKRLDITTAVAADQQVPARPTFTTGATASTGAVPGDKGPATAETDPGGAKKPLATTAPPPTTAAAPATTSRRVVPFAAVLYQPSGEASLYVNTAPLLYERQSVTVDYVIGDLAVLSSGPPPGTAVVIVGAPELSGIEFGVGE